MTDVDADSVNSSPRSDHYPPKFGNDAVLPRLRFMCSFGGKILPRPHDNQLRYVGGETRIVAVSRHSTFASLLNKLSKLSGITNLTVKYQLPNEDLDALITVTTDEDVENMLEEYERIAHNQNPGSVSSSARLRLFLFSADSVSRASSISSLLDGSAKREHWFLDALNGGPGPGLERNRSEVSSIVSEVPDYLFGLDSSDDHNREPKPRSRLNHEINSVSDPGSPNPVISSPFCSASSSLAGTGTTPWIPPIPDLRPVKTKPENPIPAESTGEVIMQQPGYMVNPNMNPNPNSNQMWRYVTGPQYPGQAQAVQNVPVYYMPNSAPVRPGPGPPPIRPHYIQQYPIQPGQIPVSEMGQVYQRPGAQMEGQYRVIPDGVQPVYYGVSNVGAVPGYPGRVGGSDAGEEIPVTGAEVKGPRISWS
jgi:hypothetical protein